MTITKTVTCCALFVGLVAGSASAQERMEPSESMDRDVPRVVEMTPDETVRVQRYVREETDVPAIEEHMTLRPGSVLPEGVPLRVFNGVGELARYAYFVSVDHKIVVTDPRTRVVVRIIDQKS